MQVTVVPRPPRSRLLRPASIAVAAYIVLRLVLAIGHEVTVAAIAWTLQAAVATSFWEPLIRLSGLDPIYAGAAIHAMGGVQVLGFAIAGPIGELLHPTLPALFLGTDHLFGRAAFSTVTSPGAAALGRGPAGFAPTLCGWLSEYGCSGTGPIGTG